jgi:hypothetical protein
VSSVTDVADHLYLAAAIESGAELTAEDRRAVADMLRRVTLPPARNGERDRMLIECRRKFYAGRTDHDASQEIAFKWRRYAASGWRLERERDTCPPNRIGKVEEALFKIMKMWPGKPLSASRIRTIVAHLK